MKQRQLCFFFVLLFVALLLSGCNGKSTSKISSVTSVAESSSATDASTKTVKSADDSSAKETENTAASSELSETNDKTIEINEKMYVSWINEIYTNSDRYIGETIKIEGMFKAYHDKTTNNTYNYVYRVGPGCCGNDGSMCGFEFTWDGDMPKDNDWIEVVGTLDSYMEDDISYLTLRCKTLQVKTKRGKENVLQ